MDKSALIEQMKVILSTAFTFYLKTHNFHWNVTGPNFEQYHSYFGDLYTEVWESIDDYAEHIRALGSFSPGSMRRFSGLSVIEEETSVPSAAAMFQRLKSDNQTFIVELKKAATMAEKLDERGVLNFLEGQIDAHEKIQWKLTSFIGQ